MENLKWPVLSSKTKLDNALDECLYPLFWLPVPGIFAKSRCFIPTRPGFHYNTRNFRSRPHFPNDHSGLHISLDILICHLWSRLRKIRRRPRRVTLTNALSTRHTVSALENIRARTSAERRTLMKEQQ
ncbi:hypothetical protein PoB_006438900 [Plakobranchus ocellatus]|uniref:Uncharacterized protein n=1 Tax=Plakobranchus ocellatus TaxID=259542 RepID=A0AAV4D103_9GAST|nr:hypothetical protein PoB_006438900 [Plakobranchus ocellatus]